MDKGKLAGDFLSCEGVRQGDNLGSLLFALSLKQPIMNSIIGSDECHVISVMDDIYYFGPPAQVFPSVDRFINAAPTLGFNLNFRKSVGLLPNLDPVLVEECTSRNLQHSNIFIPALGSIISRDPDVVSRWLMDRVNRLHEPFFKALLDTRLPCQHAFTLLRSCMVPRMNYWSRITPPSVFRPAAEAFDRLVVDTFCSRMKLPALTDEARTQLTLPVRVGGFGLSSLQNVSPAAWYCAFAHAFPRIRAFIGGPVADLSPDTPFVANLSICFDFFRKFNFPRGSPACVTLGQFVTNYEHKSCPTGSQRLIMAVVYNTSADSVLQQFPHNSADRARLYSIKAPYSGSWLTTPPIDPLFTLEDHHFSLATRLRLGLALYDDILHCVCGASLHESPHHFLSCKNLSGMFIKRHDRLVSIIVRVARHCGVISQIEPRVDEQDKSRGDGHLFFHSQGGIFDVRAVHPSCPSLVKLAQRQLGAARSGETKKINQYGPVAVIKD